jgi:hypothetical protein
MNERERADALARTIDEMLRGTQTSEPRFDDEDLRSLIRVADARRQASIEAGRRSADHESAVWQRLVARLENHDAPEDGDPDELSPYDDMRDVVAARRRVSEDVLQLAEQHREEVWRRVQERISKQRKKRTGIFSFLQSRTSGDVPAQRSGRGHTSLILTGDNDVDSLLRVALINPSMHVAGRLGTSDSQSQLRARMRSDPARLPRRQIESPSSGPGLLLSVGAVAVVALAAVILGPIPFTGLSESPAAEAARFLGKHLGVTETDTLPPAPGEGTSAVGQITTAAEAGVQLGLALTAPSEVMSLPLAAQKFFPQGIAGSGSGSFVVTYVSGDGASSIVLYQEGAGGDDLAVPAGSATHVLVDGSAATYYEGSWSQAPDGSLAWQSTGTQTLVFERDGIRFTVRYTGPRVEPADLAAAAGAIR